MKKLIFVFAALLLFMASCKRSAQPETEAKAVDTIPMMIMQIQNCSKLYTAEYHVHKIITHDDDMKLSGSIMKRDFSINVPLGKRKVAIPMDAKLKAYIDFKNFSKDNIHRNGTKIEVVLPDPRVVMTSTRIDHAQVKQYVALTRSNFSDDELANYEQQGRKAIINDIPGMGIIETARESAARTLIPMIEQMGYAEKDISVSFRKEFTVKDLSTLLDKTVVENGKPINK